MKTDCVVAGLGEYEELPNGVRRSKSVKVCKGIANPKDGLLIANAPELLEALESATELIAMHYSDKAVIRHYRGVIAKAKGK